MVSSSAPAGRAIINRRKKAENALIFIVFVLPGVGPDTGKGPSVDYPTAQR